MENIAFDNIIESISELDFYKKKQKEITNFLEDNNPTTFWQILRNVGGSDRRILRMLNELLKADEITLKRNKIFAKNNEKIKKGNMVLCRECKGNVVSLNNSYWKRILKTLKKEAEGRPRPTFVFDQRPITLETNVRRAAYLALRGDIKNKDIVLIGDDDLTSLAIGLTRMANSITVLDIDERLLGYTDKMAKKYKLNVKTEKYDLTKDIPKKYANRFDVFLTDPTPNPEAFHLFVSLGLSFLRKGKDKVGYVSFFPSHQEISIDFQKILSDSNVIITDIIPKFTEYDFIEETYNSSDKDALKKFDSGEKRFSFHENLTRFITTEETKKGISMIKEKEKFLGKATMKVLSHPEMDPAYSENKEFVEENIKRMKRDLKNE